MKKSYLLTSALMLIGGAVFSQNFQGMRQYEAIPKLTEAEAPSKAKSITNKAPLDTLYYEDFGSGGPQGSQLPAGWSNVNRAGNNNVWIWSDQAPGGQYSTNVPALASPTASNGYMSLPMDLYNTPTPAGGFVDMDLDLVSPAITITPSDVVILQYRHLLRYNGSAGNTITVQVSTDGINWVGVNGEYRDETTLGRGNNTGSPNGELVEINISDAVSGSNTVYLRWNITGISHYYWMFDDVVLLQGLDNNMELEDYSVNSTDQYWSNPLQTITPQCIMTPWSFDGAIRNAGANDQTDVYLKAEVFNDSTLNGSPGTGLVWADSTFVRATSPAISPTNNVYSRDTVGVGYYINTFAGNFRSRVSVVSDSVNDSPDNFYEDFSFTVSDSVLARDQGTFSGGAGPGNYVVGGLDNDKWGSLFSIGGNTGAMITSVSIYVADNPQNDGVAIVPKVWKWNGDTNTVNFQNRIERVVAENYFPTTITSAMYDTWITIPLEGGFRGTGPQMLQPDSQYVIGWEQISGQSNNLTFRAGRDRVTERIMNDGTTIIQLAGQWYWTSQLAGIRGNFGGCVVGVDEAEAKLQESFAVTPNPSNGNFTIEVNSNVPTEYRITLRNSIGQSVYEDNINVNGTYKENLNFENLEKGLYFVTLRNGDEKLVKKVVLK